MVQALFFIFKAQSNLFTLLQCRVAQEIIYFSRFVLGLVHLRIHLHKQVFVETAMETERVPSRGVMVHVFVSKRYGTDVMVQYMQSYKEYL